MLISTCKALLCFAIQRLLLGFRPAYFSLELHAGIIPHTLFLHLCRKQQARLNVFGRQPFVLLKISSTVAPLASRRRM